MNKRVIDILFVIILLSPPFKFANRIFALPGFITGPFTNDLVAWPLLIGIIYTLYCQYKYGNVLVGWKRFKKEAVNKNDFSFFHSPFTYIILMLFTVNCYIRF